MGSPSSAARGAGDPRTRAPRRAPRRVYGLRRLGRCTARAAADDLELTQQGGADGTVDNDGATAFAQGMPSLSTQERTDFAVGNSFFNQNWVTAPASTKGRDGLGPLFNAQSCSSCHFEDGRGQPPTSDDDPVRGLLMRLSVRDERRRARPAPGVRRPVPGPVGARHRAGGLGADRRDRGARHATPTARRTPWVRPPTPWSHRTATSSRT